MLVLMSLLVGCGQVPSTAPDRDALPTLVESARDMPAIAGAVEVQGRVLAPDGVLGLKLRDGSFIEIHADDPAPWEAVIERRVIATGVATALRVEADGDPTGRLAVSGPPLVQPANVDAFTKPPAERFADVLPEGVSLAHPPVRGPIGPVRPVALLLGTAGPLAPLDAWVVGPHAEFHLEIEPRDALDTVHDVVPFDVEGDGQLEVVVLADWITGAGPTGAVPSPRPVVLAWDGQALTQRTEFDERLADVSTRRALAEAFGATSEVLPSADLHQVLALAEACARTAGAQGRGGSPLAYGPGTSLAPIADTWLVTIPEQDAGDPPRGAAFTIDPNAGTCDGTPVAATPAGAPVDASKLLAAARECAERDHDGRGSTGSRLLLDEPTVTWRGPGEAWGVSYEERTPAGKPNGLRLRIASDGTCTATE